MENGTTVFLHVKVDANSQEGPERDTRPTDTTRKTIIFHMVAASSTRVIHSIPWMAPRLYTVTMGRGTAVFLLARNRVMTLDTLVRESELAETFLTGK